MLKLTNRVAPGALLAAAALFLAGCGGPPPPPTAVATGPIGVFFAAASGPVTLVSIDGSSFELFAE